MKVLIVDDSPAFRAQTRRALETLPGLEVVGGASNGRLALAMVEQKDVQLVIVDLNMPEMDGLELLARLELKRRADLKAIVFTGRGDVSAGETLKALALGASDFVQKPIASSAAFDTAHELIRGELAPRIEALRGTVLPRMPLPATPVSSVARWPHVDVARFEPEAVVIASSTGGPAALEALAHKLVPPLEIPLLIVQHMPSGFTRLLAERLADASGIPFREAVNGERLEPGVAYVAPGDWHMRVQKTPGAPQLILDQEAKVHMVRPAADPLFATAAQLWGSRLLAFVLTGMGEDGARGAELVKHGGGAVVIQDEASSVVWGMPGAVASRGAFDASLGLDQCAQLLARVCRRAKGAA